VFTGKNLQIGGMQAAVAAQILLNFAVILAINSGRFCPGDRMHFCIFINVDKSTSWVSYLKAKIQKLLAISMQKH
jgi:hypothetical protein